MEKFIPENSELVNTKHRRRHHAPTRRSRRRGEILKKCEEILENLRSQVSDLRKEAELEKDGTTFKEKEDGSTKREKLTVAEPVYCSEEDKSEKEGIEGSSGVPWNVDTKPYGKLERVVLNGGEEEAPVEALTTEGSPATANSLLAPFLSLAVDVREREEWKNAWLKSKHEEENQSCDDENTVAAVMGGVTVAEVPLLRDARMQYLSLVMESCDRFARQSGASADGSLVEVGLLIDPIGQAQYLICTPPQFINRDWELQAVKGMGPKRKTKAVWKLEDLDFTYNSVGPAHRQVSKYGNSYRDKGVLEVIREVKNINSHLCLFLPEAFPCVLECKNTNTSSQTAAVSTWDQFINISPLSSFINVEAMGRYANPITDFLEEFALLILGVAYSKNRAVAILCFLLKNTVENRAFDPGGNFSVLYITQSSCFKLWNPLFSNYLLLQQYPGLSFTIAAFKAFLNCYKGDSVISVASTHYHKNLVEPQAWSHIIPPLQSESELSKESIGWLYEWLRGFVGDLNGIIENKPLELHDKEEENNSDFDKSKWHKLIVEHIIQMVESPVAHMWDPGGLTRDEWNPCGIKRDEAMQESANTFVLASHENHFWKEEEVTWLAPFLEGRAAMIFAEKWNGVLMFEMVHSGVYHGFISHTVMVLVLYAIPTYEGGAHNGEGLENLTQAWLQTRKEIWVERLIQGLGSSRIAMEERHHKQWDPGEPYSASCIIETFCFKLWDPGGRLITVRFGYLHLEDKVNFEGEGIDTDIISEEQIEEIPK